MTPFEKAAIAMAYRYSENGTPISADLAKKALLEFLEMVENTILDEPEYWAVGPNSPHCHLWDRALELAERP